MEEYIEYKGKKIYFTIIKKKVKNINLSINKDNKITVSIPNKMSKQKAIEFVQEKSEWIIKKQKYYNSFLVEKEENKFENGDTVYFLGKKYVLEIKPSKENVIILKNNNIEIYIKERYNSDKSYIEKIYEKWIKEYSLEYISRLTNKFQKDLEKLGIPKPIIKIRKLNSSWGKCIPVKKEIVYNSKLIKTPIECIEYVVLHELSHFKHPNHSKNFYSFIEKFMPDWKQRIDLLNKKYGMIII